MNARFYQGLLCGLVAAGFVLAVLFFTGDDVQAQKKKQMKEIPAGVVPQEYGDLVAFTGQKGGLFMMFKDDKGTLRWVEASQKVKPLAYVIQREY